jgi:hypothetical protein
MLSTEAELSGFAKGFIGCPYHHGLLELFVKTLSCYLFAS